MQTIETLKAKITDNGNIVVGRGHERTIIHNNHSIPVNSKAEIKEDVWDAYVVFEMGYGNSALLHGLMAENADMALQEMAETLFESDGQEPDLVNVAKLEF